MKDSTLMAVIVISTLITYIVVVYIVAVTPM